MSGFHRKHHAGRESQPQNYRLRTQLLEGKRLYLVSLKMRHSLLHRSWDHSQHGLQHVRRHLDGGHPPVHALLAWSPPHHQERRNHQTGVHSAAKTGLRIRLFTHPQRVSVFWQGKHWTSSKRRWTNSRSAGWVRVSVWTTPGSKGRARSRVLSRWQTWLGVSKSSWNWWTCSICACCWTSWKKTLPWQFKPKTSSAWRFNASIRSVPPKRKL